MTGGDCVCMCVCSVVQNWYAICSQLDFIHVCLTIDYIRYLRNNHIGYRDMWLVIIIIMAIFKCYFSGEHIALSFEKTTTV